jgi:hypothetical protein
MVFQRNNRLVTVLADDGEPDQATTIRRERGAPVIAYLPLPSLWELLSKHISWTKYDARVDGYVDCDPPKDVVAAVHARGQWPKLRSLQGITTSPLLRADGSIFSQPGYDPATGFLYFPTGPTQPIPEAPTREDALAALDQLLEVVCDFEFATPAHQAAWVAALLTPLARATYQGNTPLFLIDANSARSGKSRLCDCISLIVANKTMARSRFTQDDDEQEKRCMTHLQAGDPVVLFDNVAGAFGGTTLDALLTSEGWFSGRLLGKNGADARLSVRNLTVWFATANNATLAGDLFGRCVHVRLESTHEHPEERTGFRHADLLGWVRLERPRLLAAALTILRAWFVAGKPRPDMPSFGSFEAWSEVVRSVCLWLALPDPWADTKGGIREADQAASLHAQLLEGWQELDPEGQGLTAGEAARRVEADLSDAYARSRPLMYVKLADALGAVGLIDNGKVSSQRLGKRLQSFKNKRLNGCWFERIQDKNANVGRWRIVRECGYSRESIPSIHRNCQIDRNDISKEGKVATPGITRTPGANGQLDLLQTGSEPVAPAPAQTAPVAPATTASNDDEGGL